MTTTIQPSNYNWETQHGKSDRKWHPTWGRALTEHTTRGAIEKPRKKALTPEWDKHGRRQPRILADWRPDQVVSRRLRFQGYRRVVPVVHRHGVDRQSGFARPHRGPTDPLDLLLRQKYPFAVTMSTTIRYVPIIIAPLR